jgi:hypothetical protein
MKEARCQWLTPVILANQEDCGSKPARANSSTRPYLKKTLHKKRLVEWFKVKALSSYPSTTHTKKKGLSDERKS